MKKELEEWEPEDEVLEEEKEPIYLDDPVDNWLAEENRQYAKSDSAGFAGGFEPEEVEGENSLSLTVIKEADEYEEEDGAP